MGRSKTGKKRKKSEPDDDAEGPPVESTSSDSEEEGEESSHVPYYVTDYTRLYPEDSAYTEFVVFVESADSQKPIGTRDLVSLSNCLRRYNKGVKYLRSLNKFKIGVYFEKPTLANAFVNNKTFLQDNYFKATIPASSTEVTGIIRNVPIKYSNKKIYTMLSSWKKIISIRRFYRKVFNEEGSSSRQPTQTIAVTFAATQLPDYVDMDGWRHNVSQYVPPVKQCYRCLRYGHISKFCKNEEKCSICNNNHNFKVCATPKEKAVCAHCRGNHISISAQCPIKQQKILENKNKHQPPSFASLFNKQNFPEIKSTSTNVKKSEPQTLLSILNADSFSLDILLETIIKLITLNKTKNTAICSQKILEVLSETLCNKNKSTQK